MTPCQVFTQVRPSVADGRDEPERCMRRPRRCCSSTLFYVQVKFVINHAEGAGVDICSVVFHEGLKEPSEYHFVQ